jgi:cell filamentation protein
MYDAIDDPYTYENSTVLVNKLELREQAELDAFEAEISTARADEPLPEGNLDFAHYKAVHNHLFQDVYEWAGQVRTVRIFKGGNPFCFPENIENQATKLFGELQADNFLQGLDGSSFADKAAHFLAELNAFMRFAKVTAVRSSRSLPCWLTMLATRLISTSSTRLKCWMP